MFTKMKRLAAVGAAVAGVGWVTGVSPAAANAQPLSIPWATDAPPCPPIPGTQYLADPDDANSFYVCADGLQQDHQICPPGSSLDMDRTPPECLSGGFHGKP